MLGNGEPLMHCVVELLMHVEEDTGAFEVLVEEEIDLDELDTAALDT